MKRALVLLVACLLAAPVFAGGKQEGMGTEAAAKKVTLHVLVRNWALDQDAPFAFAKKAMEVKHPNVTIELEGLGYDDMYNKELLALGSNQQLDVMQIDNPWVGAYAEAGLMKPITKMITRDKATLEDELPVYRETSKWNGEYYGYWFTTDTRVLGWNKKLVAAAGLDPEKSPVTYDELIANAAKAQNPPTTYGYYVPLGSWESTSEKWLTPLYSLGGTITNGDFGKPTKATVNGTAGVRALQLYVDMVNKYKIVPPVAYQSDSSDDEMWNQRAVYAYDPYPWENAQNAGWSLEKYYEYFGKGLNPRFADGKVATQAGGYLLSIPKTAVDPELSWEFIKNAMQPENLVDLYIAKLILPVTASMSKYAARLEKEIPYYKLYTESQKYTLFDPMIPQWTKIIEPIYTAIQTATLQKATPQQALDQAAKKIDEILAAK
jgi:multiple sugar transport system substrate-binding protein